MQITGHQWLRDRTAGLLVDWAKERQPPFTGESAEHFPDAIHLIADAARRTGLSWSDIGNALGMSRQAAQQRFGTSGAAREERGQPGEEIVRRGATAFNEVSILREEGRKGRELIRIGPLSLTFRPTSQGWEYCRRLSVAPMAAEMERAGWTYVASWLPFHYFKREMLPE